MHQGVKLDGHPGSTKGHTKTSKLVQLSFKRKSSQPKTELSKKKLTEKRTHTKEAKRRRLS